MGGSISLCSSQESKSVITIYGDHFNPDTRSVLNILNYCQVEHKFVFIDTLSDDTPERTSFKQ